MSVNRFKEFVFEVGWIALVESYSKEGSCLVANNFVVDK